MTTTMMMMTTATTIMMTGFFFNHSLLLLKQTVPNFTFFCDRISVGSSGWHGTHYIDDTGLKLEIDLLASACQVLGLKE